MKIGIGTVQFGLDYGISNSGGITSLEEVGKILTVAKKNKIRFLDTAAMYGDSEEVIGKILTNDNDFDIVTKTPRFNETRTTDNPELLELAFQNSLNNMKRSKVYGLLIHDVGDILVEGGNLLIEKMMELKERGFVDKIGISVYSSEQIDMILDRYNIDIIQLPINVLDQRLLVSGHLVRLKEAGIEIHARSAFLQGLLLMKPAALSSYFDSIKPHLKHYFKSLLQYNMTPLRAAISFVVGIDEIDVVVCGVNNHSQLEEICGSMTSIDTSIFSKFAVFDEDILNPVNWKN